MEHSCLAILRGIQFFHVLSLSLSFLGVYDPDLSIRYLIPCYVIIFLSAHLNATQQLLDHAEAINAISPGSEYRTHLNWYEYPYVDMLSSHTPMQFGEPICGDACGEQSRPGAFPAIASRYPARLDLSTLCPLLSN
jgi:hypothetical protein